jgi:hypothetical protein
MAQQGRIHGTILDKGTPQPFVKVQLLKDDRMTGIGALTDDNGKFEFNLLDPGDYTVEVIGVDKSYFQNLNVASGEWERMAMDFSSVSNSEGSSRVIPGVEIFGAREIFSVDPVQPITISHADIVKSGNNRDITSFVASSGAPIVQKDAGDPMSFKGGRPDANATYIDGMKLRGTDQLPLGAIEQITVMASGLPAEYGDVTGAVVVVTTRNPGMTMGHVGKPLTKAERQQQKQIRKNGNKQGAVDQNLDGLVCL